MLGIEDFAKQVEDRLNVIASNYEGAIPFKIYTNLGDYVQAYRVINEIEQYQFGIMRVLPSEIVPVKGLSVQNLVIQVEFGVEIDKSELDDDGNYLQVVYAQKILNEYAQSTTGTTETITGLDQKDYTVAYGINPCTVGSVTMTSSDKGEVLPVQITIDVSAVENGVNLNDIDVFIDGEAVYPLNIQATRKRVPNENSFSNKTSTSVGMLQNGFGLDLIVPALYNKIGETILDDIYMGKDNVAHEVSIQYKNWLTYYSLETNNANMQKHYSLYTIGKDSDGRTTIIYDVAVSSNAKNITLYGTGAVFNAALYDWGDETTTDLYNNTHTYTTAKTYTVKITLTSSASYPINNYILPRQYNYIMTFGNTDHNTAINTNINPHISLVEGVPYILDYSNKWSSNQVAYSVETTISTLSMATFKGIIFWGDGTFDYKNSVGVLYHTYKAGTYTQRIFSW